MIVNYYKMSGEELKRIYEISRIKGDQFAELLGISRAKLYTQFKQASVDLDVEAKVLEDPELAKNRQLFSVKDNSNILEGSHNVSPSAELWAKALDMLQETIKLLADNNKFIQKDAEIFRDIVEQGVKTGAISFNKLSAKKA